MAEAGTPLVWRKRCFCNSQACIEVASSADRVLVRDSSDPAGPRLAFTADAWREFLAGLRRGALASVAATAVSQDVAANDVAANDVAAKDVERAR